MACLNAIGVFRQVFILLKINGGGLVNLERKEIGQQRLIVRLVIKRCS